MMHTFHATGLHDPHQMHGRNRHLSHNHHHQHQHLIVNHQPSTISAVTTSARRPRSEDIFAWYDPRLAISFHPIQCASKFNLLYVPNWANQEPQPSTYVHIYTSAHVHNVRLLCISFFLFFESGVKISQLLLCFPLLKRIWFSIYLHVSRLHHYCDTIYHVLHFFSFHWLSRKQSSEKELYQIRG